MESSSGFDFLNRNPLELVEYTSADSIQLKKAAITKTVKKKKRINRIGLGRDLDIDNAADDDDNGSLKTNIMKSYTEKNLHLNSETRGTEVQRLPSVDLENCLQLSTALNNEADASIDKSLTIMNEVVIHELTSVHDSTTVQVTDKIVGSDLENCLQLSNALEIEAESSIEKSVTIMFEVALDEIPLEHDSTTVQVTDKISAAQYPVESDVIIRHINEDECSSVPYDGINTIENSNIISNDKSDNSSNMDIVGKVDNAKLITEIRLEIEATEEIIKQLHTIVVNKTVLLQRLLKAQHNINCTD